MHSTVNLDDDQLQEQGDDDVLSLKEINLDPPTTPPKQEPIALPTPVTSRPSSGSFTTYSPAGRTRTPPTQFITRTRTSSNSSIASIIKPVLTTPYQPKRTSIEQPQARKSEQSFESTETLETLEPVSLNDDENYEGFPAESSRIRSGTPVVAEPPSPSLSSKLNISSAFGYAASLLPTPSPVKSIDGNKTPVAVALITESSTSEASKPVPSSSWTSSFSSYFGGKSPIPAASSSTSLNPPSPKRPIPDRNTSSSTAFILHNLDATKEERRQSTEAGGADALREGFERVKRDSARIQEAAAYGDLEDEDDLSANPIRGPPQRASMDYVDGQNAELGPDGIDWNFWGLVMNDYEGIARSRPKDLSRAIQQGIPAVVRGTIWQLMSSSKSLALEATYASLLKEKSPHEKAIQKDLARTFPGHRYFAQGGGVGQENLFNVVKAYSLYDEQVGYTQGVAFIVAALLLNMPDEEAFCILVRLMESYNLRTHYLPEMPGLQLRMFQFERLLEELLPVLHLHFVRKGVKSSMYASTWFLTLFTHRFPLSLVYRIFDIVLAEGIEAIFRFSLALMRRNEEKLLALDFEGILKFLGNEVFDCYKTDTPSNERSTSMMEDDSEWLANEFVSDAFATQITPFMLDSYGSEWEELCRVANAHATEMDALRSSNRVLSIQVKQLEGAMAAMSEEHVDMVKQLVQARIDKEAMESELIRYKTMYAELVHEQDTSRASYTGPTRQDPPLENPSPKMERSVSATSITKPVAPVTTATFHLTLMREALSFSYLCEVSQTAFSVGSIIFLPRSSSPKLTDILAPRFTPVDREGLILSHGYSRQLPGNTHAEANAIHNLVSHLESLKEGELSAIAAAGGLDSTASVEEVAKCLFSKSWIYATMEPCSKRTSGLKDCTAEIIYWGLKRVYMGVREPDDYVECQGLRLLREAGIEVVSVQGMEEECLSAARRGL